MFHYVICHVVCRFCGSFCNLCGFFIFMFSIGSKSCHYAIIRVLQQGLGVINPTLLLLYFYLIQSNIEQLKKYHKKVF